MKNFINKKEYFEALGMCKASVDYYDANNLWGTSEDESVAFLEAQGKHDWVLYWKDIKAKKCQIVKTLIDVEFTDKGKYMYELTGLGRVFYNSLDEAIASINAYRDKQEQHFLKERIAINHASLLEDGSKVWRVVLDLDTDAENDSMFCLFNHETGKYIEDLTKDGVRENLSQIKARFMTPFCNTAIFKVLEYPDGDPAYEQIATY